MKNFKLSIHRQSHLQPHRVCSLVVALWACLQVLAADSRAVHTKDTLQTPYRSWMRWVPDSTPLTILSLPSTHDTMARFGGPLAETQSLPLNLQLQAGIRGLDIRARHVDDRYEIYHGIVHQKATFDDVLTVCNIFLDQNPTETIVLWLSKDGVPGEKNVTRSYRETYEWYRDESGLGRRIYRPANLNIHTIPLGSIRGKIVVLMGFFCPGCGVTTSGIPGNTFYDLGTAFELPKKWESIVNQALLIDAGSTDTLYSNGLSASSENGGIFPIDAANGVLGYEGMNPRYLRYLFTGNQRRTTGMMWMDFPGSALIAGIIAQNMKHATNFPAMAGDFAQIFNDLSYSARHDGDNPAPNRAAQMKNFLNRTLPNQFWSVLVTGDSGRDNWGFSTDADGLVDQSDWIDGFSHIAINSRKLDAKVSKTELQSFLTPLRLAPLGGDAVQRASDARKLLKNEFPAARWNVAVKKLPFDGNHWASDLAAAASVSIPVVDEGSAYLYTAWATSASNRPPVIVTGGPYSVPQGSPVHFDLGKSEDPDGEELLYRWDFDGNGTWDTEFLPEPTATWVYETAQSESPRVEAFDGEFSTIAKVDLKVINAVPTLQVGSSVILDDSRRLVRNCQIIDGGTDRWNVDITYGDGTSRINLSTTNKSFVLDHVYPAKGSFTVRVDVRDSAGAQSTTRFEVATDVPSIQIQRISASQIQLSWDNHPAPLRVESATPRLSAQWTPVLGSIGIVGDKKQLTLPAPENHSFYRLSLP